MKRINKIAWISLCAMVCLLITGTDLFAAEEAGGWREKYDLVLKWVNFIILASLIIKFARTPLKDFLKGQREKLAADIRKKEKEKDTAAAEVEEIKTALNEGEARFQDLKDRIVEQGKKRKEQAVEEAKEQSRLMLVETQKRVENQILKAKKRLKAELVDAAVELALQRLPKEITSEDNQKFLGLFLSDTHAQSTT
ncbi:MAG TPA: ATP synthase F0 subunit B [Deltaproteobacteria bacterium]|nr:ATP synthase F0 subunit B [Deltaproteobacteria bacterium]